MSIKNLKFTKSNALVLLVSGAIAISLVGCGPSGTYAKSRDDEVSVEELEDTILQLETENDQLKEENAVLEADNEELKRSLKLTETPMGVNSDESIISRESAVSLFSKDGSVKADSVQETMRFGKFWVCEITVDDINYLVDVNDYSHVMFVGYESSPDADSIYHSILFDNWSTSGLGRTVFKIYGQDGKIYYIDSEDFNHQILAGIDCEEKVVNFPGYYSTYYGIPDHGRNSHCCEFVKDGIKYLTDLYDFTKIIASGYQDVTFDKCGDVSRMILTYPDGSMEIYNADALNIVDSDILVTNVNKKNGVSLILENNN